MHINTHLSQSRFESKLMRKNLIYLILVLALAATVVFIFTEKKKESQVPADQDFAFQETARIDKIFMADKGGNKVILEKQSNHWIVNNKFPVMPAKIKMLLKTIRTVAVANYVSKPKWDQVIRELATTSTKVELYKDGENQPFKVYHVGGDDSQSNGTYMIMEIDGEVADRPFLLHIPGFTGTLSIRYFLDENEWRDTEVFDYEMEDIKQVHVEYPGAKEQSFVLNVIDADSFSVRSLDGNKSGNQKLYKQGVVKYLSSFNFLNAETYVNDHSKKDSISATTPFAIVSVTDQSDITHNMTVFYMPQTKRSKLQFDPVGNKIPYDLDRFFALVHDGKDFVVIQDFVFSKIFRKYDDFFIPVKEEI